MSSGLPMVEVPGGRVEYEDVPGDPDRPPLLFLHEGLGSVGLWRGFHQRVAAATGCRTVAYSRLGHGWSDPPPEPRTAGFMRVEADVVVPALRAALGLDRPVLVGHSDGGSIALLHAAGGSATQAAGEGTVSGLVVLAPHVFVEPVGLLGVEEARRAFTGSDLRARMARRHRDPVVAFHGWNDVWLSAEFRDWDIRPRLAAITCPVLGVQGTTDPYGTVAHVEAVREGARGPVELLVLDCGHAPHLERPGPTIEAVVRCIAAWTG